MNYKKIKKLLDEQFKLAIELDDYWNDWKWMRVNSDDPNSQVYSGRLATALQRPGPALQYLVRRDIHLVRKRFLITKRHASLKVPT